MVSTFAMHKEDEPALAPEQAEPRKVVPLSRVIVSPATALVEAVFKQNVAVVKLPDAQVEQDEAPTDE
jgi:hypothetical protein